MRDNQFTVVDTEKLKRDAFKLPQPLIALQENAKTFINARLSAVFDHVDDAFFDLADRAESNRSQTIYFDAMRLIRVERRAIEHHFFNTLTSNFCRLGDKKYRGVTISSKGGRHHGLEVIENEALEEMIALDTMVSKSAECCKAELELVSARIDSLVPAGVSAKNNPVGPDAVCEAFNEAVAHLELSVPIKLVLLKLFDRHVMTPLKDFLLQSDQLLKGMGVVPSRDSRRKPQTKQPPTQKKTTSMDAHEMGSTAATESTDSRARQSSLKGGQPRRKKYGQLISQLQNIMQWEAKSPYAESGGDNEKKAALDVEQLSTVAAEIQSEWSDRVNSSLFSGKGLLELIDENLSHAGDQQLSGTERGVVSLLDRLFSSVNAQSVASSEISRELRKLELPILQIALQDATFFDREKHPARRLLNEIAEAAIGFSDDESTSQDPVAMAITEVSESLYNEHELDNAALTQLLLNFIERVEKERRRVATLEQRLVEEVAAAEKVNQAHQSVVKVLVERVQGKTLPKFLISFTEDAWSKVLFLTYLKLGVDSDAWCDRVRLLDQLLEFVEMKGLSWRVVSPVIESIKQQLEDISYDPYALGRLVGAMEQYFQKEPFTLDETSMDESAENLLQEVLAGPLKTDIPGSPSLSAEHGTEDVDEAARRQAESLSRGSWVEVRDDASLTSRCKVAGIVSPPGKLIFVNRLGQKVSEKHRNLVALDFQNKKIKPLEKTRLFDRALEGVVTDIRDHRVAK